MLFFVGAHYYLYSNSDHIYFWKRRVYRVCATRLRSKAVHSDTGDGNLPCAVLPSLPSPTLWKTFACVVFRVTVTVTGDGRGDANLCTVSRFVSALFAPTSYPSCFPKTPHRATWRRCEHKCGVYLKLRRTTEQSNSNHVDMLFALFVFCSFLFGNVRSVFVLVIVLKARKCAEYCTCSFCSVKKRDTPDLQVQSKKCGRRSF